MSRPGELPTTERRSRWMSRVKTRDTAAEMRVRRALWRLGARYRLQARDLPGKPDIVNRRGRWAIFVHGCFWHFHQDCPRGSLPKRNHEHWKQKLEKNRARDYRRLNDLLTLGYSVLVVWECETHDPVRLSRMLKAFLS